tara:strand:+ start:226 stop:744 length:519 start_codon:yes stop_codon:yes gene_type:complete
MNLFILDKDPVIAAKMYCDKHVIKLILECYQMLGSAVISHGAIPDMMPLTSKGTPLRGGYHFHPVTKWVGKTRENFLWTSYHAAMLCEEYTKRYGKTHACSEGLEHLYRMRDMIPEGPLTPFAQAMPDEYKVEGNAVAAYRQYYIKDKSYFAAWNKGRDAPDWYVEGLLKNS